MILYQYLLLPVWLLIHLANTIGGNKIVIWIVSNFDILWVLPVDILEGTLLIRYSLIAQRGTAHLVTVRITGYDMHLWFRRPTLRLVILREKSTRRNDVLHNSLPVMLLTLQLISCDKLIIRITRSASFVTWERNMRSSPRRTTLNLKLRVAQLLVIRERIIRHGTDHLLIIVV